MSIQPIENKTLIVAITLYMEANISREIMESIGRLYSIPQAAVELGLYFSIVRNLARKGVIVSRKSGRKYLFTQDALDKFKRTYERQLADYANRNKKVVLPPVRFVNIDYVPAKELLVDPEDWV